MSTSVGNLSAILSKWGALTAGMGDREASVVAWVMECEVSYLRRVADTWPTETKGFFKYLFPIIRRVVPQVTVLDLLACSDHKHRLILRVLKLVNNEAKFVLENDRPNTEWEPLGPNELQLLKDLAIRIVEAIQSFPEPT